jgi:toxin ParE1/3/4
MIPVLFHPEASAELTASATWYESQQPNLGKRFIATVQDAINHIIISPRIYPIIQTDVRRCLLSIFPYGVLFKVQSNQIIIVAIMHLHRDPDYWKTRTALH